MHALAWLLSVAPYSRHNGASGFPVLGSTHCKVLARFFHGCFVMLTSLSVEYTPGPHCGHIGIRWNIDIARFRQRFGRMENDMSF